MPKESGLFTSQAGKRYYKTMIIEIAKEILDEKQQQKGIFIQSSQKNSQNPDGKYTYTDIDSKASLGWTYLVSKKPKCTAVLSFVSTVRRHMRNLLGTQELVLMVTPSVSW